MAPVFGLNFDEDSASALQLERYLGKPLSSRGDGWRIPLRLSIQTKPFKQCLLIENRPASAGHGTFVFHRRGNLFGSDELAILTNLNLKQVIDWLKQISLLRQGQLDSAFLGTQPSGSEPPIAASGLKPGRKARPSRVSARNPLCVETPKVD